MTGINDTKTELNGNSHGHNVGNDIVIPITMEDDHPGGTGKSKYNLRDKESGPVSRYQRFMNKVKKALVTHKRTLEIIFKVLITLLYYAYFGYAVSVKFGDEGSWRLTICTIFGTLMILWRMLRKTEWPSKIAARVPEQLSNQKLRTVIRWALYLIALILMVTYLVIYIVQEHPQNLVSLAGITVFLLLLYIFSTNRSKVRWHTVFWGMTLQFGFAVVFLQTSWGVTAMTWVSDRLEEFTVYADDGSKFIVGDSYKTITFLFQMSILVLVFVVMINTLTYLGVTAFLIRNVGGALSYLLDAHPVESIIAAANIFLGSNESMMMIKDNIPGLTRSQLFCTLVCGLSSVAGSAMITFSAFGVPVKYLLSASLLSAPAALATAKLCMPEENDEEKNKKEKFSLTLDKGGASNVLESISLSVLQGANLIKSIVVTMLVFIALSSFIDATFAWFGDRIDIPDLTFKKICSYVLWPLPYLMGVSSEDSGIVAQEIGVRMLTNAGVAYIDFGELMENRKSYLQYSAVHNDTVFKSNGDVFLPAWNSTLANGFLDSRSEIIGVYALCGFASVPFLGMNLGIIGAIAPKRLRESSQIMPRAFCVSTIASFLTACMAGLLYVGD